MKNSAYFPILIFLVLVNTFDAKSQLVAEAGKDTVLCKGNLVKLGGKPSAAGGAGGYKYTWYCNEYSWIKKYASDFLNDTTLSNPDYTVQFPDIKFYLKVTDSLGNANTDSIFIGLSLWGTLDWCGYSFSVRKGDSVQICTDWGSQFGPFLYQWSPSNTLSNPIIGNPYAKPDKTTIYTVIISDTVGCVKSHQITVTVLPNSINQTILIESIEIYPNPFDKICMIKINIPEPTKVSLQILDISGKVLRIIKPETSTYELNKGDLPAGFYSVLVKLNNETISIKKLIVQ